ncbi:MAG: Rab family GTPase [Candidatus Thorarchaeota archaeon]
MVFEKPPLAKVIIAGASGVGKTSLVNRLVFEDFSEVEPTIGVNFAQKICHGETGPVNLSIWDLSGHPRFQCLMPRFCQGATGIVLVVDITAPDSIDAAKQWLDYIASYNVSTPEYAVVLAVNKIDLQPRIALDSLQSFIRIHQIFDLIRCSAKSGENVKLVFNTLCSAMQRYQGRQVQSAQTLASSSL